MALGWSGSLKSPDVLAVQVVVRVKRDRKQFKVWEILYKWMALWVPMTFQICPNPLLPVYRAWWAVRVLSYSHCLCAWILCSWNVLFCRAPPKHTPSPPLLRFPWYLYLPLRAPVTVHITAYISPFRLWILCWTHISLILTTISVLVQSRWLINICWTKRKEKKRTGPEPRFAYQDFMSLVQDSRPLQDSYLLLSAMLKFKAFHNLTFFSPPHYRGFLSAPSY